MLYFKQYYAGGVVMAIGLTTRELVQEFTKASTKYQEWVNKAIYNSITTEDEEVKSLITEIRTSNPNMSLEQINNILVMIFSFAEMITKNNESLAKMIPHEEAQ
jgi:hypothetical protein